ncbi:MAG: site-specific integrase [Candidatus Sulfobium sp.]|jgi:integrase
MKINGRRLQESLKTDNRKLAEKIFAKVVTEAIEDRYFERAKAKRILFSEMVEKYLSKYERLRDRTSLTRLLPVFGNLTLAEITTERLSDYHRDRLKVVKPATVYQELSLMRRMFNVARREWKWVRDNPVSDISFSVGNKNARERWLTIEEEKRLLDCAGNPVWLRPVLVFALHTGMRRGEILNLKWTDVDFNRRLVRILKSKNGEKRSIPMSRTVYELLRNQNVRDISGRVFPVSARCLRQGYEKAISKAVLHNLTFHDLRHTFATRLVQNGVDLYKVKELLGHKTIAMTMRYSHHYPESLRSSVEILDSCYNSATLRSGRV